MYVLHPIPLRSSGDRRRERGFLQLDALVSRPLDERGPEWRGRGRPPKVLAVVEAN